MPPKHGPVLERAALGALMVTAREVAEAMDMKGDPTAIVDPERIGRVAWAKFRRARP